MQHTRLPKGQDARAWSQDRYPTLKPKMPWPQKKCLNISGALIRAAVKAGLYLGNPDDDMIDDMEKYAENLGLAYQIADDILDVVGDPEEMGKAMGSDQKKNKNTYPSVNGLDAAYKRLREVTDMAVEAIAGYYDNAEFFRDLVLRLAVRKK